MDMGEVEMFDFVDAPPIVVPPDSQTPGQYPGQNQGSIGLKIKSSKWFGAIWVLEFSGAGLSPSDFLDVFLGELVLAIRDPTSPTVDVISACSCYCVNCTQG